MRGEDSGEETSPPKLMALLLDLPWNFPCDGTIWGSPSPFHYSLTRRSNRGCNDTAWFSSVSRTRARSRGVTFGERTSRVPSNGSQCHDPGGNRENVLTIEGKKSIHGQTFSQLQGVWKRSDSRHLETCVVSGEYLLRSSMFLTISMIASVHL